MTPAWGIGYLVPLVFSLIPLVVAIFVVIKLGRIEASTRATADAVRELTAELRRQRGE